MHKSGSNINNETNNPTKILSLNLAESMVLDDQLTVIIESADFIGCTTPRGIAGNAISPAPIELLEKIGFALLYCSDPENESKEALIEVTYAELMCLREVSASYIEVADKNVGFNLKRKIYSLMLGGKYGYELNKQSYRSWLIEEYDNYKSKIKNLSGIRKDDEAKLFSIDEIKDIIIQSTLNGNSIDLAFIKRSNGEIRKGTFRAGLNKKSSVNINSESNNTHNLITLYDADAKSYKKIPLENIIFIESTGIKLEIKCIDKPGKTITKLNKE